MRPVIVVLVLLGVVKVPPAGPDTLVHTVDTTVPSASLAWPVSVAVFAGNVTLIAFPAEAKGG